MSAVAVLVNKLFNIDAFDPEFNKNCAFPSELLKSKRELRTSEKYFKIGYVAKSKLNHYYTTSRLTFDK